MGIDKIAVVRLSADSLAAFAPAEERAPDGWTAHAGEGGALFCVRALEDGALIMPFANFDAGDELALHLRLILGAALDQHDDERGICLVSELVSETSAQKGGRYEALVAESGGTWIPKIAADDPRVPTSAGWTFSKAAELFSGAAKHKPEADDDPLQKAEDKFGQIFAERAERGALRRTLSAAIDHSIESSALLPKDEDRPTETDLGNRPPPLADALKRGVGSDPRKASALEGMLRESVGRELEEGTFGAEPGSPKNVDENADENADESADTSSSKER